jgi:glycosyltransferase involved in cell wall biosynthesis
MTTSTKNVPAKKILEIGNWPPPVCSWSMSLVGLRKVLEDRGWDCQIMNLNENRRVKSPQYIDVQDGWDYFVKVLRMVRKGYTVHVRVNGETRKGYLLALAALCLARIRGTALLTYGGGHQQKYFPAPDSWFRRQAFALLFRLPHRIYCNSEKVKGSILTAGIRPQIVVPIPHFSTHYVQFVPTPLPPEVEEFYRKHDGVFFSYVCFRPEFTLDFLAEAIRRFRSSHPNIGFMMVGPWDREMGPMIEFLKREQLEGCVCVLGSVPHELFLTLLSRSLAYIRTPITDGVCSSVLESLKLKVPVLAAQNEARPPGTELWTAGDVDSLFALMENAVRDRAGLVARIPDVVIEDNAQKLADSIEEVWLSHQNHEIRVFPMRSKA